MRELRRLRRELRRDLRGKRTFRAKERAGSLEGDDGGEEAEDGDAAVRLEHLGRVDVLRRGNPQSVESGYL